MPQQPFFKSDSPLGLEVQKMLLESQNGLTVAQLRYQLRRKGNLIEEKYLRELLSSSNNFISLPNDTFCLRSKLSEQKYQAEREQPKPQRQAQPVYLQNLPLAGKDYLVLDLETTGLNSATDKIIQLVAIKYQSGEPVAALNYYFNPAKEIPYTLRLRLGLERHPEIKTIIQNSPEIAQRKAEILAFLGDLPIVAHNARFDSAFLFQTLGELSNPIVDTMEMAFLLFPNLSKYKLETLANHLKLDYEQATAVWEKSGQSQMYPGQIAAENLHDAVTDTCLLALIYQKLYALWYDANESGYVVRKTLVPESYGTSWQPTNDFGTDLKEFFRQTVPRFQFPAQQTPSILFSPAQVHEVEQMLERYWEARGFSRRFGQAKMTGYVWEGLNENRFKLIEAPTGTGKTIACLIPALVKALSTGERVALSTAYRNLQDQLLAEIETVNKLLGISFRYQVMKGIANYPCYNRLLDYVSEFNEDTLTDERFVAAYLLSRALVAPNSTFGDLNYWVRATYEVATSVYTAISAGKGGCTLQHHEDFCCPLGGATVGAKSAHLLLINHDLWLTDPDRLPTFNYLILDEAHTLEDVATRAHTSEVSHSSLHAIFDSLLDRRTGRGILPRLQFYAHNDGVNSIVQQIFASLSTCRRLTTEFQQHLADFIKVCQGKVDVVYGAQLRLLADPRTSEKTRWSRVEGACRQLFEIYLGDLLATLQKLMVAVNVAPEFDFQQQLYTELKQVVDKLIEQRQQQAEIIGVTNTKYVYWVEVGGIDEPDDNRQIQDDLPVSQLPQSEKPKRGLVHWALKAAPIRVAPLLQSFYEKLQSAVLVSATLSIRGGDFSFFLNRLGLTNYVGASDAHMIDGDLNYGNAFLGLANYFEYTPVERTINSFKQELAHELKLLLNYTDGRTLALFTARERMDYVFERCVKTLEEISIPLYRQEPGVSRQKLKEEFAERTESVLMGLQSFWEGVDVPGESLSFVVMEKLPFPFMFDPIFKARREDVISSKQHDFADFIFPLMAIRFKQGFGRLLRTKDDRGAVILLDRRIHRKTYKYELLDSLPGFMSRDEQAERDRRSFYLALAEKLPGLINSAEKEQLLADLPLSFGTDLVVELAKYALPNRISPDEYEQWRPVLLGALKKLFRFPNFRSVAQEEVVRQMLAGEDVLALLPTGAGKSLCFQLTAFLREGLTIIFSPLIALMRDQVQALNARGIEIVSAIYSGQAADEREETLARVRAGRLKLLYISPERLRDQQLLYSLAQASIRQIVVDEAHCVAMWGPSFRPDFLYLSRLFRLLPERPPLAAFTATATPAMRQEIVESLQMNADYQEVIASFDRPELRLVVYNGGSQYNRIKSKNERLAVLLKILEAADQERDSVIIYVATTWAADLLARKLAQIGYDARAYHGKMDTADRADVQELFMDDHINIVVCTKAFGMGIDKPDIRYVIHYNTPGDLESYYQEAGRAGRDGQEAYCVLLYHPSDRNVHDYFIESGTPDWANLVALYERLTAQSELSSNSTLYLNPRTEGELLGLDEVELKINLHLLEQQGFIERQEDFTLSGGLTLLADAAQIEETLHLQETDARFVPLFAELVREGNLPFYRQVQLNGLKLAKRLQISPQVIDELFGRLAVLNLALYRPWEKGYVIRLVEGKKGKPDEAAVLSNTQRQTQERKLDIMLKYAEAHSKSKGVECRRAQILAYFGEKIAVPCGGCDLCAPEYEYPWSKLTHRDVARSSDYFDIAFTLLQIVKWSADVTRFSGYRHSGNTLVKVLQANSYSLGKGRPDARARLQRFRQCPYWGIFDNLPNVQKEIEYCFNRLVDENYLNKIDAIFEAEEGRTHAYTVFQLAEKGEQQLLSGKILGWKVS